MPRVDESKQNKGINNNTRNKQMAIDMEYQNRLNHPRFKSPYFGAKYQQRVTPVRTLNGIRDVFIDKLKLALSYLPASTGVPILSMYINSSSNKSNKNKYTK